MNLLFANQRMGAFGGAEAHIQLCASELRRRGHRLGLLYSESTGKAESAWHALFPERFQFSGSREGAAVDSAIDRFQPDLNYVHNLDSLPVMEAIAGASVPFVRMVHDHNSYCMRSYKYNYFTRNICTRPLSPYCVFPCLAFVKRNRAGRFPVQMAGYHSKKREVALLKRARLLVANSDYIRRELIQNGCDPKRIVLHCPVAPRRGDATSVSSLSDRNLILFAGQIIRGKGVDLLLRALSQVRERFECVILGDGNYRSYCEKLSVRLGLEQKVRFAGFLPPEQTEPLYLQASVFVVSSVWPEPFGLAGPEAMRFGLPVVAFDAGGIKEWLTNGKNGFLVPWKDTRAFAARVDLLLGDKKLARTLGLQGQRDVARTLNLSAQVELLEGLFSEIISEQQTITNETHSANLVHGYCH